MLHYYKTTQSFKSEKIEALILKMQVNRSSLYKPKLLFKVITNY